MGTFFKSATANWAAERVALLSDRLPPTSRNLKSLFFVDKLQLVSTVPSTWINAAGDIASDLNPTTEFGALVTNLTVEAATVLGSELSVRWPNTGFGKPFKTALNITGDSFTVHLVYAFPGSTTVATDKRLLTFAGTDGKTLSFRASTLGGVMGYTATGASFATASTVTNSARYVVSFTFNNITKVLNHYVNGVLISTFTIDFTKLVGTLYVGSTNTGGAVFQGYAAHLSIYEREFTAPEITAFHSYLTTVFS